MEKKLILFTLEYPYGKDEAYIENEINFLAPAFDCIYIVTGAKDLSVVRSVPANVKVLFKSYELTLIQKLLSFFHLFNPLFWQEIKFALEVYQHKINASLVNTILQSISKSYVLEMFFLKTTLLKKHDKNTLCYSYWSNDNAVCLAMLRMRGYSFKAVCRAHRWDVYFDKSEATYLPFRKPLATFLNAIYFVAEDGLHYFKNKTKINSANLKLSRLGVYPLTSKTARDFNFHLSLFSCSAVCSRKRVSKIAEALMLIDSSIQIQWTHIGDGALMEELKSACHQVSKTNPNIHIYLKGALANDEVKVFYAERFVDVFLNVSESEGIPVSIMEAMSVGIPAIATDVDGNREIVVHKKNGFLISKDFDKNDLAKTIYLFHLQTAAEKETMRKQALDAWRNDFCAEKNYTAFVESILAL